MLRLPAPSDEYFHGSSDAYNNRYISCITRTIESTTICNHLQNSNYRYDTTEKRVATDVQNLILVAQFSTYCCVEQFPHTCLTTTTSSTRLCATTMTKTADFNLTTITTTTEKPPEVTSYLCTDLII